MGIYKVIEKKVGEIDLWKSSGNESQKEKAEKRLNKCYRNEARAFKECNEITRK